MKIAFYNSCKKWGGGEKWHHEVAVSLFSEGFDVMVFANKSSLLYSKVVSDHTPIAPVKVSSLSFLNLPKLFKQALFFRKLNIDVIVLNLSADVKFAGIAARLAGVKNIIYRRGSAIPIKNSFFNRFLFKRIITNVLANSNETAQTILVNNNNLFSKDKIKVIYNGIDINAFCGDSFSPVYSENNNELVLGNLARLSKQKGQKYLINLANALRKKGLNFKLLIGGSGELETELKMMVKQLKLESHVKFVGFVEQAQDFLSSIDIFVFPSVWEGFGFSIIEAKYMEKPVVAFRISSNPEVICDNVDGFLVEPFDEDDFLKKVECLLLDEELRLKMGKAGKLDVENRFTKNAMINSFKHYLEEIIR